jgi:hypothetical protein
MCLHTYNKQDFLTVSCDDFMIHQCRQCVELDHTKKLNISCSGVAMVLEGRGGGGGGGGGGGLGGGTTILEKICVDFSKYTPKLKHI